jgi:hypothetical protein
MKDMTKREFTEACAEKCTGLIQAAAKAAIIKDANTNHSDNWGSLLFVNEMLEQDSDEGSRSGTKRVLGEELYAELQKFKTGE